MALNGLGDDISVECDHRGNAPRRSFQGALPGQVIAFIHDAAQWNGRLLHRPNIAGDTHQNQAVPRDIKQRIRQRAFECKAAARIDDCLLKDQGPRSNATLLATTNSKLVSNA